MFINKTSVKNRLNTFINPLQNSSLKNEEVIEVLSGQIYVTADHNLVLSSVLGSCVSICLFDPKSRIGGMNHFLLPYRAEEYRTEWLNEDSYGLISLEKTMALMLKEGAKKSRLQAKIFGGAEVVDVLKSDVAASNIKFARTYLKERNVKIKAEDVGGKLGRRIFFALSDFSVYVKKFLPKPEIL